MSNNSNSASYTSTSTLATNEDRRSVTDGGALSVNSRDGGNLINYTVTDQGSMVVARDIAMTGLNNNATNVNNLLLATYELNKSGRQMVEANAQAAADIAARGAAAASAMSADNRQSFGDLLDATVGLFKLNSNQLSGNMELTQHLAEGAASAYSDATAQATGTKTLLMVGVAVVGLVAVAFITKKN